MKFNVTHRPIIQESANTIDPTRNTPLSIKIIPIIPNDIYMANREVELREQYRDSILASEELLEIVTKKSRVKHQLLSWNVQIPYSEIHSLRFL